MLVVVAIDAEKFPVATIVWIVVVDYGRDDAPSIAQVGRQNSRVQRPQTHG